MNYLIPIPYNYSEIIQNDYSEIAVDLSTRIKVKEWVQDKLKNTGLNTNDKQIAAATLVITVITSIAIVYLPKFIVLGCTVISAIAYIELARILETKSGALLNTIIAQKTIGYLVDPNQKGQKFIKDLKKIECELEKLKKSSSENLEEDSSCSQGQNLLKKGVGNRIGDLFPDKTQKLKKALEERRDNLKEQLKSLESDLPYFKKNASSLTNLADIWQKIDQNYENRMTVCRDFMFYSLMGTTLINTGRLKELIGEADYARYIICPSLIITLGMISVAYAAKQAFSILVHRNNAARKEELLSTTRFNILNIYF
ncbi:MAG: hypothetical protein ACH349_04410 [Candidatus Rhabdochlamydia sp.]|nr:hypothetical protein [Chlamydiota bacterium]